MVAKPIEEGTYEILKAKPRKERKRKYNYTALVTALKNGKKYALPATVTSESTVLNIRKKLRTVEKLANAQYFEIEGVEPTQYFFEMEKKKD